MIGSSIEDTVEEFDPYELQSAAADGCFFMAVARFMPQNSAFLVPEDVLVSMVKNYYGDDWKESYSEHVEEMIIYHFVDSEENSFVRALTVTEFFDTMSVPDESRSEFLSKLNQGSLMMFNSEDEDENG